MSDTTRRVTVIIDRTRTITERTTIEVEVPVSAKELEIAERMGRAAAAGSLPGLADATWAERGTQVTYAAALHPDQD